MTGVGKPGTGLGGGRVGECEQGPGALGISMDPV